MSNRTQQEVLMNLEGMRNISNALLVGLREREGLDQSEARRIRADLWKTWGLLDNSLKCASKPPPAERKAT